VIKTCTICGNKYKNRDKRSVHCGDRKCLKIYNRNIYKTKKYLKKCKTCGIDCYLAHNQILCVECKKLFLKKSKVTQKIIKEIRCRRCDCLISIEEKYKTKTTKISRNKTCDDCKKTINKINSESKIGDKNPNWTGGKKPNKYKTKAEFNLAMSIRMKKNNPMKNKTIARKMGDKLKNKYLTGELIAKKGKDNHLWKGNRENSFIIRSRLTKWRKHILKRDDYTCQLCKSRGGKLEIHHLEPFKCIIENRINILKINKQLNEINNNSDEFEMLCDDIVNYHDNNTMIGITLCKVCHAEIDVKRHI